MGNGAVNAAGLNRDEREDLARFILRIKHELGANEDHYARVSGAC